MLENMKNKSNYIEELIKKDMNIQKDTKLNDIDLKIVKLNEEKEKQIRELEEANVKKILEAKKKEYEEELTLWEERKKDYFERLFYDELDNSEREKFGNGLEIKWNNLNEFYEREIEEKPKC
jgi:predicted oxidoreductase (fatty acid repression mutant protein)